MHTHSRGTLNESPASTSPYSAIPRASPPTRPTPSRNTGRIHRKAAGSPDSSLFRRAYSSRDRASSTRAAAAYTSTARQPSGVRPLG